jgi:predicted transcriptional regulator
MAGRKSIAITDRQFQALNVLWEHGALTVRELMDHLPKGVKQPYTTVLGLLQNMEKAGLVDHEEQGTTYRYRPTLNRQEATRTLLSDFVSRFFRGSAEALVLGLVDSQTLSAKELGEIDTRLKNTSSGKSDSSGASSSRSKPARGKP